MSTVPPAPCPLCLDGGATALWSDERLFVIAVADADYPGYTRVIWRKHVPEMSDLSLDDRRHLMDVVNVVESAQRACLAPHKINLAAFGNMVPHLHWHIIPRWRGDRHFPDAIWAPSRVAPGAEPDSFLQERAKTASMLDSYHLELLRRLSLQFQLLQENT